MIGLLTQKVSAQSDAYFTKTTAIDGLSTEWSKDLLTFDRKTQFTTAVRNDTENLYILFQTSDRFTMNKLLQAGMEVTLKSKTKPKLNAKLSFPLAIETASDVVDGYKGSGSQDDDASFEKRFLERMTLQMMGKNEARLKGFSSGNGRFSLNKLPGVEVALAKDETKEILTLSYEMKIPLATLFGTNPEWDKVYKTALNIKINVNDIPRGQNTTEYAMLIRGAGRAGTAGTPKTFQSPNANQTVSNRGGSIFDDQYVKLKYRISRQ
ncbi:hypothetical protein BFP71_02570 [Roseivirga misakiensis]|uniref:Uncharacterized protein n=1 Tax=Roseivirga misakiensis TaxID=1563681 RepID=A0A1E5T5B7_9BACT|nr:hypothetical protein BFP71_02570 [Roseivirga misakiensis]